MNIGAVITGHEAVIARLEKIGPTAREALRAEVQRAAIKLLGHVKQDKLSGQVLQVQSGRLRRSISQRVEVEDMAVTGIVGTNLSYARFHEYGFTGTESVHEYFRKCKSGKVATVRAHSREVRYPAHSFLRSALEDMKDEILAQLHRAGEDAIKEAMRG